MSAPGIIYGPLAENCVHLCVDMQRLFGPGYPWSMPWQRKVLPAIEAISGRHAERSIFTRFIPAERPGEGHGTWARYYHRWAKMTLMHIGPEAIRLVPELERFVPPGKICDKAVYSPWVDEKLDDIINHLGADSVIITGGETDICVLATVLGAIDRGLRVILVTDALCSSSDHTHDALMQLYFNRFSEQIETATTQELLEKWH